MNLDSKMSAEKAFTLIELLIVVAIIAILAAIAVPNFLEAQVRAKVSRVKSDLRTTTLGLEAYRVDNNAYPRSNVSSRYFNPPSQTPTATNRYGVTLERLTTPVAYLSGEAWTKDPFEATGTYQGAVLETVVPIDSFSTIDKVNFQEYWYVARSSTNSSIWTDVDDNPTWYALESAGPDGRHHNMGTALNTMIVRSNSEYILAQKTVYDPTNGTASRGSIWRVGGDPGNIKNGYAFYDAVAISQK